MLQVLFRIPNPFGADGLPVYGFGMMLFLAFIGCTWLAGRRAQREGISKETIQDLAVWLFIGGLLGARITYLLNEKPRPDLLTFFKKLPQIWEGGIVFYGSVLGGLAAYLVAYFLIYRKRGLNTFRLVDAIAPSICLGLCLGRMGCFLNGCCYGGVCTADHAAVTPVTFPLSAPARDILVDAGLQTVAGFSVVPEPTGARDGVLVQAVDPASPAYDMGLRPDAVITGVNGQEVHNRGDLDKMLGSLANWKRGESRLDLTFTPEAAEAEPETITIYPRTLGLYPTQVYETVSMILLMMLLLAYYPFRRVPGQVGALLMLGYGVHRYLNEILRDDPRPEGLESYGSVFLVAAGVLMWIVLWRIGTTPPTTTRPATPEPAPRPA
jgi:phosphatidylglycerol:prolipoprotein diacylglycerol transferase